MKLIFKYRLILLAIFAILLFTVTFNFVKNPNIDKKIHSFQQNFSKKEKELEKFIDFQKEKVTHQGNYGKWDEFEIKKEPFLHIFKKDSLVYWNTNQLPVLQYKNIHFPTEGLIHLQNGWYYSKIHQQDGFTIVATFLIRSDYPYENDALKNEFPDAFAFPLDAKISLEEKEQTAIYSNSGDFIFSLDIEPQQTVSDNVSLLLCILLLGAISLSLLALFHATTRLSSLARWLSLFAIIGLRLLSLRYNWLSFMSDNDAFQPSLYASSELFPNFFEYLVNCAVLLYISLTISKTLSTLDKKKKAVGFIGLSIALFSFVSWYLLIDLTNGLIENSSIPLLIDRLFSLNAYSLLTILSIGALYYGFYRLTSAGIKLYHDSKLPLSTLAVIIFLSSVLFFILEISTGTQILITAIFPLIFLGLITYQTYSKGQRISIGMSITFLFLFSLVTATNLSELSQRKERDERELFANQLASDKDVGIELEYEQLAEKIKKDSYLNKFVSSPKRMNLSDFEEAMERRFFNGAWERYEMNFNLYDTLGISLIADESQNFTFNDIQHLKREHSIVSEVNPNMFYIDDYTDQYSYVITQRLYLDEHPINGILICTLKSKKIPEGIGFPRLLISSNTMVFKSLENYSIARYHQGKLITKYGNYNFPTKDKLVKSWKKSNGFVDRDGYNHFIHYIAPTDLIILSAKNYSYIELVTSFSYLFCFFGLLLLPSFFSTRNSDSPYKKTFTLAAKIQLVLIGLVFVSLLAFGWGSGVFVSNQYNTYTDEVIREKVNSVNIEIKSKLGTKKKLDLSQDGNYIEYILRKFSRVFVTDINFYNKEGILIASSRPKVYNIGLLSEQMNPSAYHAVSILSKSEFIHQENIGKLSYSSAYLPFVNNEGELLGYVNLQHFGQQEDFEAQIQRFLVAIINVFMLLLAISVIIAIFISSWVTAPLRLLQENFAGVKFGKFNQQINYKNDDEIGALVKDYNQKLEELEYAAQQIAKNERESAWREMAKQVAHEIKNPLTPMKLSIQHLQRIYDPNNPNSGEKLNKVAASLIEQIDALTKIANEFSNFAKMPHLNEVELNLIPLIDSVIEVFKTEQETDLTLITNQLSAPVLADKDQMLRVFNNLIKNAIQSIPEDRHGKVEVLVSIENSQFRIEVKDNGIGIPSSEQSKIFVPYFTTKSTGTGLGLAMVRQIVENHRGSIDYETIENKGTSFIIYLPILSKKQDRITK